MLITGVISRTTRKINMTTKKTGNKVYIKSPNKQPNSIMAI